MSTMSFARQRREQGGIVSIFTATMLIIVVSLIVLGLAQISRNEQRTSLDTQLSTQAFYAAESGINDAIAAIQTKLSGGSTLPDKTSCAENTDPMTGYPALTDAASQLKADGSVSYSCLLINAHPNGLHGNLSSNSIVYALTPTSKPNFTSVTLQWDPATGGGASFNPGCPTQPSVQGKTDFTPLTNWTCSFGVVRIDLVPTSTLTRAALATNNVAAFLVPTRNNNLASATVSYAALKAAASKGQVVPAACTTTLCTVVINVTPGSDYYMRAASIYRSGFNMTVSPNAAAQGFTDSQVQVDVTGKAQDVLRRILVSLDISGEQPTIVGGSLMSGDSVCKRFTVFDQYFDSEDSIAGAGGNQLCQGGIIGSIPQNLADFGDYGPAGGDNDSNGSGDSGGGTPPVISFKRSFRVNSASRAVDTCVFSWGDGSTTTTSGAACNPGGPVTAHVYPNSATCKSYTVKLTLNYAGGGTFSPPSRNTWVPWGQTQAQYGSPC